MQTFADKHGDALRDRLFNYCDITSETNLPEVHQLLVKSPKNHECGILNALLSECTEFSLVPLTTAHAPIATTQLIDNVFHSYAPGGTGLIFRQGLSPFSIMCEGHKEIAKVCRLVKSAEMVESGSSLTLADASTLTSQDIWFPTKAYVAVEKLHGWSVMVDVFHGVATPLARNVQAAIMVIGPCLHWIVLQMANAPAIGMDLVCHIMFELQQDYFTYLTKLANNHAALPPTFTNVTQKVTSYRADSLSPLPMQWCTLVDAPTTQGHMPRASPSTPWEQAGVTSAFNSHADCRLLQRFHDCEHSTISQLTEGHSVKVP